MSQMLIPFISAFAVTVISGIFLIPWLHKLKFGQEIREEGPSWHQKKSGTPTMGGIMMIAGVIAAYAASFVGTPFNPRFLLILCAGLGFGAVGFADDYIKVVKKRNLGLTSKQKFSLQLAVTAAYLTGLYFMGGFSRETVIPFTGAYIEMPVWLYIPFVFTVITGTVNAVNLTDGLDGLASSVNVPASLFFMVAAVMMGFDYAGVLMASAVGACMGFLIYNHYPARVFMGDTGSLFLGGMLAVTAVETKLSLVLVIAGFVYLFEALSVIIQVTSFKLTGKRVFKMSPVHHHFEMCGWKETKIVAVFTAVTVVLCFISVISLF
ncbi:MAG: phospho-N-acetylmuramoyl-pentapeptide-transferase [Oscillospiraceae bacterium]|nr:phospho-N-acetylmuramoyl-pentapeptide-transferase [Oscillospiraceae bacterium]